MKRISLRSRIAELEGQGGGGEKEEYKPWICLDTYDDETYTDPHSGETFTRETLPEGRRFVIVDLSAGRANHETG